MSKLKRICLMIIIFMLAGCAILSIPSLPFFKIKTGKESPVLTSTVTPAPSVSSIASSLSPTPTLDLYTCDPDLPYDKLFTTKERQLYRTGDLTLIIPKLSLKEPVQSGTDKADLSRGPGLYDYAQLPGEGNRNVSIAAHRNKSRNGVISEWFFYYIDTLCKGDYMYLVGKEHIYRYIYDQTTIVEENDWSPIYSQGFSCITLTSCEPIGVADHRIIVRGKLDAIDPYTKNYVYTDNETSSHSIQKKNSKQKNSK